MLKLKDLNLGTRRSYIWSLVDSKTNKTIYSGDYKGLLAVLFDPEEYEIAKRVLFTRKKGYRVLNESLKEKGLRVEVIDPATNRNPYE